MASTHIKGLELRHAKTCLLVYKQFVIPSIDMRIRTVVCENPDHVCWVAIIQCKVYGAIHVQQLLLLVDFSLTWFQPLYISISSPVAGV